MAIEYFGQLSKPISEDALNSITLLVADVEGVNVKRNGSDLKIWYLDNNTDMENILLSLSGTEGYVCFYNASTNQRNQFLETLMCFLNKLEFRIHFEEE